MEPEQQHTPAASHHGAADQHVYIEVWGEKVPVPKIYPPLCLVDAPQWEPAPDPDDADKYAEWGRKHYGDAWYQKRKQMLEERKIYISKSRDSRYTQRQLMLRKIENTVEGRCFPGDMKGDVWREAWAKMSQRIAHARGGENVGDESRYENSSASSDKAVSHDERQRSSVLLVDKRFEALAQSRQVFRWSDEQYEYEKLTQLAYLHQQERNEQEDKIGDRLHDKARQEVEDARNEFESMALDPESAAYDCFLDVLNIKVNRLEQLHHGMALQTADAYYARNKKAVEERNAAHIKLLRRGAKTPKQLMRKLLLWQRYGLTVEEHERLTQFYHFTPLPRPDRNVANTKPPDDDYFSRCRSTPISRPRPTKDEMLALATFWENGLILNEGEVKELFSMYGHSWLWRRRHVPRRSLAQTMAKLSGVPQQHDQRSTTFQASALAAVCSPVRAVFFAWRRRTSSVKI